MSPIRVLACLIATYSIATLSHAAVILTHDAGTPTPGLAGYTTYIVTATSTVPGEPITGIDFYGSGSDGSPTARGFFGAMNQYPLGPFSFVFQDWDAILVPPELLYQDSNFIFKTSGPGAVNAPAGFVGESATSLRALFSRFGGFGQSVPLARLVLPSTAAGQITYKGTFSVLRDGLNVTLPEIMGIIPIPEPSSAALVGAAFIAVATRLRRRKPTS